MKKMILLFLMSVLIPGTFTFADRGAGGGGRDGGGSWDGGGGGDRNSGGSWDGGGFKDGSSGEGEHSSGSYSSSPTRYFGGYTGRGGASSHGSYSYRVPQRLRQMGVSRVPRPIGNRSSLLSRNQQSSRVALPRTGPDGAPLKASVMARNNMNSKDVRSQMSSITSDRTFNSRINALNASEHEVGHYYWHNYNGVNYCHYYDRWGCNWYGWYFGGFCFWTQFYWGNWWWWDPFYDYWCYWYDGWWWWQDPYHYNTVYIYEDGQYVPAGSENWRMSGGEASNGSVFHSQDGTRMVKISGESRDAFLYDTATPPSFKPLYLASGVKEVRFSKTSNGRPLQIMLVLQDGSFDLFDDSGNPYNGNSPSN